MCHDFFGVHTSGGVGMVIVLLAVCDVAREESRRGLLSSGFVRSIVVVVVVVVVVWEQAPAIEETREGDKGFRCFNCDYLGT